jgi:putative ABC transport system ATP-binding protein
VTNTILRGVSLEVRAGELILLIGPSGSGKSTLLAVLSGLLRPEGGQVVVKGQDLWALDDRARETFCQQHFGFIFQGCNLLPALTARQQIELVLRWVQKLSAREARQQANSILARLGLAAKADLRPAQLSGGEKQRVAIARALVKRPAFCFADEPTSALDWKHGKEVMELLRSTAHEQGTTLLMVSHDARVVPYAGRVFHLEDGILMESGPGSEAALARASA